MSEINELRFYPDGDYIIMFARRTPEMEMKLKEFFGEVFFSDLAVIDKAVAEDPGLAFQSDKDFIKAYLAAKNGSSLTDIEKQAVVNYMVNIKDNNEPREYMIERLKLFTPLYDAEDLASKVGYKSFDDLCVNGKDEEIRNAHASLIRKLNRMGNKKNLKP